LNFIEGLYEALLGYSILFLILDSNNKYHALQRITLSYTLLITVSVLILRFVFSAVHFIAPGYYTLFLGIFAKTPLNDTIIFELEYHASKSAFIYKDTLNYF